MKARLTLLLLLVGATFGFWAGCSAAQFMAVDSCLDAGGRLEARGSYCFGARAAGA